MMITQTQYSFFSLFMGRGGERGGKRSTTPPTYHTSPPSPPPMSMRAVHERDARSSIPDGDGLGRERQRGVGWTNGWCPGQRKMKGRETVRTTTIHQRSGQVRSGQARSLSLSNLWLTHSSPVSQLHPSFFLSLLLCVSLSLSINPLHTHTTHNTTQCHSWLDTDGVSPSFSFSSLISTAHTHIKDLVSSLPLSPFSHALRSTHAHLSVSLVHPVILMCPAISPYLFLLLSPSQPMSLLLLHTHTYTR